MPLITKNGQIHPIPSKKGKQRGLITKNGQISTLVPYVPTPITITGYTHTVMGVASANISTVMGVATANVSKVNGV